MNNSESALLLRRLSAAYWSKNPDISHARRWRYGTVTGPMVRLAGGDTHTAYLAAAITTHAFMLWHTGKSEINYGKTGTSIGRALRQIGHSGSYRPYDPTATRLMDALLNATTGEQLHRILIQSITRLRHEKYPPNWEQLYNDILGWFSSENKTKVRLKWGQHFTNPSID